MKLDDYRSTSCYPDGLAPTRRSFLGAMAAATVVAGFSAPSVAAESAEESGFYSIPSFPPGGFSENAVRLNFNENPLGPSKKAITAVFESGLKDGNRYTYIEGLIGAIASQNKVPSSNVLVGCGSTEFLQFTPWAFLNDGGTMVSPAPTYAWAAGVAHTMGRRVIQVPLGRWGVVDTERMKKAIRRSTKLVYLANPNNPTGAAIPFKEVVELVEEVADDGVLMIDEAYHEFLADAGRTLELVRQNAPVLVLRTFSKTYGMAGLRLGYAIGSDSVIARLRRVWWEDFGINTAAQIAGQVALEDRKHVNSYIDLVDQGLAQLASGLTELGASPYTHRAPFFMVDFGRSTYGMVRELFEREIYVQPGSKWGMPSFMRVSVGTSKDNAAFLGAVGELMPPRST